MSDPSATTPLRAPAAADAQFEERVQKLAAQVQTRARYHSIELPDGSILPGLQSIEHLRWRMEQFAVPIDLRGKRVLDIGAWDGWFSFECERRGAEVVAVDCVELETFLEAKRLIGSRVEYLTLDVNELSSRRLGQFDIVLFFGVLYHLRHPLLGLEKVVELSRDLALIESFVIAPESRPIPAVMEYYERAELGGQIDNWCGPSPECLLSFCRSAGFAQVQLLGINDSRAMVVCQRRWPPPDAVPSESAPQLRSAVNNRTWRATFHPDKDEYLCCFFNSDQAVSPETLFVEVDGFGINALIVTGSVATGWQANCLRPPGLAPGFHEVRIRTAHSPLSDPVRFTMLDDFGLDPASAATPLPATAPEMCSAELRPSGDSRYAGQRDGFLVCYFRSPAKSLLPGDVSLGVGEQIVAAHTVSPLEPGVWQANATLSESLSPETAIRVRLGAAEWSTGVPVVLRPFPPQNS